jgi:beta-glucanase (GH16 family)
VDEMGDSTNWQVGGDSVVFQNGIAWLSAKSNITSKSMFTFGKYEFRVSVDTSACNGMRGVFCSGAVGLWVNEGPPSEHFFRFIYLFFTNDSVVGVTSNENYQLLYTPSFHIDKGWHNYRIIWTINAVSFYLDDSEIGALSWTAQPTEMYLLVDTFNVSLSVDQVAYYA